MVSGSGKGFTLLEILVALAVLSIAFMAAMRNSGVAVHNATALKERTLAHLVMMNRAAELELDTNWVALGATRGTAQLAGQVWRWEVIAQKTPDPDIRRAEVGVGLEGEDHSLVSMEIYLDHP